ncbi:hypothetical protein A2645_02250 [Candidatus Nomurabacteria bacterium RIFCSPHIGHO2_01_FULL_39_9]|uniref:Probable lipid II flippase MurJ n=1 Tax=Candidatus Nomurabacteria bacterium RIFCSPHIGHO2_01_FULL_39_9 TaxID=1801735 RepID=A0A1F6UUW0_9BACT|nr:MAG: hypothetical protein A2645_02250 [Candidatus Nomurabacteria bacterium RIFCSPHIGHO2_01_FULL_39_9]
MVKRVLNFLNKGQDGINQAAILLAIFAFLAQILGLIRDRALASIIGPGTTLDVYYAAFKIPDFIFISVASLSSVMVLLPFLADKINAKEEANRFFNNIFSVFSGLLILTSIITFFIMPVLVKLIVPGFDSEAQKMTLDLSRIMLLSPIFLGLSTMFGSITQLFKKFFVYSLSPVFYNFGILLGVVWFYKMLGINGLAIGVILGALLHFAIQIPIIYKLNFRPRITFDINWLEIKQVVMISLPRTLGLALNSITLIILLAFASKMSAGSISIFNLALNLKTVPLTLIGISYSTAAFPTLTILINEKEKFFHELSLAGRQIIFWSLPALVLFIILRAQIVRVILGAGLFSWDDTRLTAAALALFALSITAHSLVLLFTRAFYAGQRTFRPFLINLISAFITVVFAFAFVKLLKNSEVIIFIKALLRVGDLSNTLILTLPLAYSIGTIINCLLLWLFLKRDFNVPGLGLFRTFSQSAVAAFIAGVVAYLFLVIFGKIFNLNTLAGIFAQGFFAGILAILAGVSMLFFLGNQELKNIITILKTKFWKTKVVISE